MEKRVLYFTESKGTAAECVKNRILLQPLFLFSAHSLNENEQNFYRSNVIKIRR